MTQPRRNLPGETTMLTRRTTGQKFFLRPDEFINGVLGFEIGKAASNHGQTIHAAIGMSNHCHIGVTDTTGDRSAFMHEAMGGIAKARNDDLNRRGYFWSAGQFGNCRLLDRKSIERKLVYIWTNPVQAGLVESVEEWPGFKILPRHWGKTIEIPCPDRYYGRRTPDKVEITPQPPPGYDDMSLEEVRQHFQELLETKEKELQEVHKNRDVKGRQGVIATNPFDTPTVREPERGINPRFSSTCSDLLAEAIQRRRDFLETYESRRQRWLNGQPVTFPAGTVQLARAAPVDCEPPDPDEPGVWALG